MTPDLPLIVAVAVALVVAVVAARAIPWLGERVYDRAAARDRVQQADRSAVPDRSRDTQRVPALQGAGDRNARQQIDRGNASRESAQRQMPARQPQQQPAQRPAQPQRAANTGASRPQPQQARNAAASRPQQRPQGGARPSR